MKKLFSLLIVAFGLLTSMVDASPSTPKAGLDYKALSPASSSSDTPANKIEVIEFFWYGCPHCSSFESILAAWLRKQGSDVIFNRVPVAFDKDFAPHQKLYHALDELGFANQLTPKIFEAIQVKKTPLLTAKAQAEFVAQHGVNQKEFLAAYASFKVANDVQQDNQLVANYHIDGVPTILVQRKYLTSPAMTNGFHGTVQVLDFLIAQIRAKKM